MPQQAAQCKYETKGKGKVMGTETGSLFARKKAKHTLILTMVELPEWIIKNLQKSTEMALESTKETIACNLLV